MRKRSIYIPSSLCFTTEPVFDGQGHAFHKALEYFVHIMSGVGAPPVYILRDAMHIRGTDGQVIDEFWRYRKLLGVSTTPHALNGPQQCVQLREWDGR